MAERAFRQLVSLALVASLPLAVALGLTLFPGEVQRALHGSDAFVQTCLAALYGLGQWLPPIGIVVLALALFAAGVTTWRALGLLARTRALTAAFSPVQPPPLLADAAAGLGIADQVVLFDAHAAAAFTAGIVRPRIYVSTAALSDLAGDELEAVLLHERAHLRRRDPLRVSVARLIASALFFVPLADELRRRFEVGKELDADRDVVTVQQRVAPLAGALEHLGRGGAPQVQHVAVAGWSCASVRIDQLEGVEVSRLLPALPARAKWLSALALAALVALALGQGMRANLVPAAAWEVMGGSTTVSVHVCPLPLEGPLL
ncbi:MAG: M56 family metallopeptidase [Candidatus Limnocylindria bacterium]